MKALIKFALAAVMLITTLTAQAGWVSGQYRSNGTYAAPYYHSDYVYVGISCGYNSGYVYRNPYPSGYYPSNGTSGLWPPLRAMLLSKIPFPSTPSSRSIPSESKWHYTQNSQLRPTRR